LRSSRFWGGIVTRRAEGIKWAAGSDHAAHDPVLQQDAVEIHQESQPVAAEPEIGHQLGLVNWGDLVDRLDLDNKAVVDDEVHLIATVQFEPSVAKRKLFLPRVWNPCLAKFKAQAFLIGALQQPWPEMPMHLNGKAYNLSGRVGTSIVVLDADMPEAFVKRFRLRRVMLAECSPGLLRL
jgi:hypothetical protein